MSRVTQVVFARSGCAFILGGLGVLIGLISWASQTAGFDYPRSPSAIVWAAVGGTFGFVFGACLGYRRLAGRPAWLVSGLVAGILVGVLIGWYWGHAVHGATRAQLLEAGLPAVFIDSALEGASIRNYETIGLQHGICLGILGGTAAGWFWNHPPRISAVSNLLPVVTSCFLALGAIAMQAGFRDLSADMIDRVCRSWTEFRSEYGVSSLAPLTCGSAAVDRHDVTGHVRGRVRAEKDDHFGDFFGRTPPPLGDDRQHRLLGAGGE